MREIVAITKCESYEQSEVQKAISGVIKATDGLSFVKPGMKIGIKTNLISMMNPDRAGTTHPALLSELCRILIEMGAEVIVGDSPGGMYTSGYVNNVYKGCGLEEVIATGAKLNQDFSVKEASFPEALSVKSFVYTGWLDSVDAIINFSKLKTHGMLGMTCAVKNMFGTIPGTTKPEYHMRFPEISAFANMMIDLNEYFKPSLYIVDAVEAMEGNGPTSGRPKHIGAVLSSKSPYDLDMACAYLIGFDDKKDIQTLEESYNRGLGPKDIHEVNVTDDLDKYKPESFEHVEQQKSLEFIESNGFIGKAAVGILHAAFKTEPRVNNAACIGCKKCFDVCPAHAITMKNDKPQIDRKKCIHCFCCQEFCPKGAMKVHETLLARLMK